MTSKKYRCPLRMKEHFCNAATTPLDTRYFTQSLMIVNNILRKLMHLRFCSMFLREKLLQVVQHQ
jgi:flagellar biosynthesis regulator FlbT